MFFVEFNILLTLIKRYKIIFICPQSNFSLYMRKFLSVFLTIFLLSITTSCTENENEEAVKISNENVVIPEAKIIEIEIMELINAYRIEVGLLTLNNNTVIKGQAYQHTEYMVTNNNLSHDNFYTRKAFLINSLGAHTVSENVAYGFSNAQSVVNAWLNSNNHKENIEGDFTDFEISAEKDSEGKWYFTNIFIKK